MGFTKLAYRCEGSNLVDQGLLGHNSCDAPCNLCGTSIEHIYGLREIHMDVDLYEKLRQPDENGDVGMWRICPGSGRDYVDECGAKFCMICEAKVMVVNKRSGTSQKGRPTYAQHEFVAQRHAQRAIRRCAECGKGVWDELDYLCGGCRDE